MSNGAGSSPSPIRFLHRAAGIGKGLHHDSEIAVRESHSLLLVQIGLVLAASTVLHAQESWDAVYLGGAKIGFIHTFVEKVKDQRQGFSPRSH